MKRRLEILDKVLEMLMSEENNEKWFEDYAEGKLPTIEKNEIPVGNPFYDETMETKVDPYEYWNFSDEELEIYLKHYHC